MTSPWMNARTTATYLDFPLKRVHNLASTGQIPCRRQGGRLLFHAGELDTWLDEHYSGPEEFRPRSSEEEAA
jgi:hypothetical protein